MWASAAEREIAEAALWYSENRAELASDFLDAIRSSAQAAATSPALYARVHKQLRRVLVERFPYALIFRESADELLILACYHLHRDPSVWQSRV